MEFTDKSHNHIIRVMIVDDQNIFAVGLKSLLHTIDGVEVVSIVKSGSCVFQALSKYQPDVLFLDINLPGPNGLKVLKRIRKHFPRLIISMMTMHEEMSLVEQAKTLGANGYLTKDASSIELKSILFSQVDDPFFMSKNIQQNQRRIKEVTINTSKEVHFSKREKEIIKLIVEGKTNHEISTELFIGYETVKTHRKNIFRKLEISKSNELVKYALEHNMT